MINLKSVSPKVASTSLKAYNLIPKPIKRLSTSATGVLLSAFLFGGNATKAVAKNYLEMPIEAASKLLPKPVVELTEDVFESKLK
jgi:hypothetical protein